jgi:hypothetical protein
MATEIFNFDVSKPMKITLFSFMVRSRLSVGLGSGLSRATPDFSLLRGRATFTPRTYGLSRLRNGKPAKPTGTRIPQTAQNRAGSAAAFCKPLEIADERQSTSAPA